MEKMTQPCFYLVGRKKMEIDSTATVDFFDDGFYNNDSFVSQPEPIITKVEPVNEDLSHIQISKEYVKATPLIVGEDDDIDHDPILQTTEYEEEEESFLPLPKFNRQFYDWNDKWTNYQWKSIPNPPEETIQRLKQLLQWDELFDYLLSSCQEFKVWLNCFSIVERGSTIGTIDFEWVPHLKQTIENSSDNLHFIHVCWKERKMNSDGKPELSLVENPVLQNDEHKTVHLSSIGFIKVLHQITIFLQKTYPLKSFQYVKTSIN